MITSLLIRHRLPEMLIAGGAFFLLLGVFSGSEPGHPQVGFSSGAGEGVAQVRTDCGPACLYAVCRLTGKSASLDELRRSTGCDLLGASLYDLKRASEEAGFDVSGVRVSYDQLTRLLGKDDRYAILYCSKGHFLLGIRALPEGKLLTIDPGFGLVRPSKQDLEEGYGWDGSALVLQDKRAKSG